jgi:hypothetical protein
VPEQPRTSTLRLRRSAPFPRIKGFLSADIWNTPNNRGEPQISVRGLESVTQTFGLGYARQCWNLWDNLPGTLYRVILT